MWLSFGKGKENGSLKVFRGFWKWGKVNVSWWRLKVNLSRWEFQDGSLNGKKGDFSGFCAFKVHGGHHEPMSSEISLKWAPLGL